MSSACGQSSASPALAKQCLSSGPQAVLPDGQQHEDIAWCFVVAGDGGTAAVEAGGDLRQDVACKLWAGNHCWSISCT